MPKLKYGLGRGLDALLEGINKEELSKESIEGSSFIGGGSIPKAKEAADSAVVMVSPDLLKANPRQPRKDFDDNALQELADSIKEHGVIQPVIAEKAESGSYFIIAGERRVRAARLAGLDEVPVIVRHVEDKARLTLALIENIQRENLNPLEEAEAYDELMRLEGLSQEEAAARVGKSRPAVANALRLLKLPDEMRKSLASGKITAGHARALLSVANPAERSALFGRIEREGLSVRECEALSAKLAGSAASPESGKKKNDSKTLDPDILALEESLIEMFGTKVSIKGNDKKGTIEISYFSADDFSRVYDLITKGITTRDDLAL